MENIKGTECASDNKKYIFNFNENMLCFLGIPIKEGKNKKYYSILFALWGKFVICLSIVYFIQLCHVYWDSAELEALALNTSIVFTFIPNTFMMYSVFIQHQKYRNILNLIEQNYLSLKTDEWLKKHVPIGEKCLYRCKMLTKISLWYIITVASFYSITPAFKDGTEIQTSGNETILIRALPLNLWPSLQAIDSSYYVLEYLIQMFQISILIVIAGLDTFYFVLIIFLTCQFEILIRTLHDATYTKVKQNIVQNNTAIGPKESHDKLTEYNENSILIVRFSKTVEDLQQEKLVNDNDSDMEKTLFNIVSYHQNLIREFEELKKLMSPNIFLHFAVTSVTVCVYGYLLLISRGSVSSILIKAGSVIFVLVRVGVYCYLGTRLTYKSMEVAYAVYNNGWHVSNSNIVKFAVLMMIHRAQKPLVFTGGKFFKLSLEAFANIIQASYSYMALLREMIGSSA